jgi:hypothetical protein
MVSELPTLPYGITNSFAQGAIRYHCPYCPATIDDAGDPRKSEEAKRTMVTHVLYLHGEDGRKMP